MVSSRPAGHLPGHGLVRFLLGLLLLGSGPIWAQSIDPTFNFGSGDGANGPVFSVAVQGDGKILIGGDFTTCNGTGRNRIARLNADGTLDTSFDPGAGADSDVRSVAVQADGKILIGGFFTTYNGTPRNRIARLNANGTLDTSFDPGAGADNYVFSMAVQGDGKILIGGFFTTYNGTPRNRIARLNADGTLDTSFDPGAGADNYVVSVAVQGDGKILIGGGFSTYNGTPRNNIARLNANGTLDTSFDPGAGADSDVRSVAVQGDGRILIGGYFGTYNGTPRNSIARLNADGSLDTGFIPGTGANGVVNSVAVQGDGRILIGGDFTTYNGTGRNRIARLNAGGSLDTGFDPGTVANSTVNSVAVQGDGKILIGGFFTTYNSTGRNRIARLNAGGSLDTGFIPSTGANGPVFSVAVQGDGKILIGGDFTTCNGTGRNRIARLNADGTLDTSFDPGAGADSDVRSVAVQADGKILIGGFFTTYNGTPRNRIARLNANGTLDTSFDPGAGADNYVFSMAVQGDGKILIGGFFTTYNGTPRNRIARLNANGTLDTSFDPGAGADNYVVSMAVQGDGKILIGGGFSTYNGTPRNNIARLNANGTLDTSFDPGAGADSDVRSVAVQGDGRILIGGYFGTYNGTPRNSIARLNADGSLDTGFIPGTGANGVVNSVAVQGDGRILIGGDFTTYNGTGRNRIARLNAGGSLDTGFDPGTVANSTVNSVALQGDGKILIGGFFTTYNGMGRNRIARLLNNVAPKPTITGFAASPNPIYAGSPTTFTATLGNVTGSYSYTLTNGTSPLSGSATSVAFSQSLTAGGTGVQSYSLLVSNGGQSASATTSLTVNPTQTIRYVKQGGSGTGNGSSWTNASGDLQSQIDIAGAQQVWVAGGLYTTTANGGSFSLKNGVAVYGGFTGSETSLGARPGVNPVGGQPSSTTLTNPSGSVFRNTNLDNTARLDGVVITGGNRSLAGGGILNNFSSPVLTNCVISGNTASNQGGGMSNAGGSPSLINCVISGNSSGGLGGGIYNDSSNPSLTNCVVSGNTAQQGGGMFNTGGSPSLTNCVISGNMATAQGGAFGSSTSGNPILTGCTLTGNQAPSGAAFSNVGSTPRLTNAILWNNQNQNAIVNFGQSGLVATYCLIEAGETDFTGSNNLVATTSPFVSGTTLQLNACSVAINAGDPASTTTTSGSTDLAGNPRFYQNGRIDIGAYEFQGTPNSPVAIIQQPVSGSSVQAGASVSVPVSVSGTVTGYQWYKDNLSSPVSGQTSATLTLTNVQTSDAGSYSLVVTGACNSVTSTAFSLTVSAPAQPIRYVKQGGMGDGTSWTNASGDLQSQIDIAGAQQVWVAAGTYKPGPAGNTDQSISFVMKNGVAIYGGFPPDNSGTLANRNPASFTTILSGDIDGDGTLAGNSLHVFFNLDNGLNSTAVLDGFVITAGNAAGYVGDRSDRGAGMYNVNASPTLVNLIFINNSAANYGAAVYAEGNGNSRFINCAFSQNGQTAVFGYLNSTINLVNCTFSQNSGGAIDVTGGSTASLTNCIVWNNGGPGYFNGAVTANYCLIGAGEVNYSGIGNVTATTSPFVSATDLRLNPCSPAINAGDPTSTTATSGSTDLAGNPRFYNGGRIDLGAYEFQGTPSQPVAITRQPVSSSSVCGGSTVTAMVSATGTSPAYQWYKGSALVSGQTSPTLTLTNVQTSDAGSYSVVVTGSCPGSVTSTAFSLTVTSPQPPTLVTQSGHAYPAGVSSLTAYQNTGDVVLMTSGCAGGTITWAGGGSNTLAVSTVNTGVQTFTATCQQNGCISPVGTAMVTVVAPTLTVAHQDATFGQLNTNTIKPYLLLSDIGTTPISYNQITVRYWLTVEGPSPITRFENYYVQLGAQNVHATYVPLSQPRQGATAYVEYSFDAAAGSLGAMSNSGPIQNGFGKADYSGFNQADDYSYVANRDYALNPRITAYINGQIVYGQEPAVLGSGPSVPLSVSLAATTRVFPTTDNTTLVAQAQGGSGVYSYQFSGPGTLSPNGNTAVASGLPAGVQTFTVTVTDTSTPTAQLATATVSVTVTGPANTAPVATPNANQTGTVGVSFAYTANAFGDMETPNSLTYTATINPANGLSFNPANRVISGTPSATGVSTVLITATDPGGLSGTTSFSIVVNLPPNKAPVATPNANQTATVGVGFTYTVNAFTDNETPGSLTYSATISPANGLSFNPSTRLISGTPSATGVSTVLVRATDPGSLSSSTSFTITVTPAPVMSSGQLTVLHQDATFGQTNTNTIKPFLELINSGTTAIPYSAITVRYYLTVEGNVPITNFQNYYVQLGANNVHARYVVLASPVQGATAYVEYSFDGAAGSLAAGANSGPIQNGFTKADYSGFNQSDDYSYVLNRDYMANLHITAYINSSLVYGTEPASGVRRGVEETTLAVQILSNPVLGSAVAVRVIGAEGQPLTFQLTDLSGRPVTTHQVERAGPAELQRLEVGSTPAGMLLLRVSSPTQSQTVKVMKVE